MKQTIISSMFHDAFRRMGREANFSYDGRSALFEWLFDVVRGAEDDVDHNWQSVHSVVEA